MFIILFASFLGFVQDVADDWVVVQPEKSGVQTMMPAEPRHSVRQISPIRGQTVDVHLSVLELENKITFTLSYHDQAEKPADNKAIKEIFDGAVAVAVARTLGNLEKVEPFKLKSHQGRNFEFTCIQGETADESIPLRVAVRMLLVENRLYSLNYVAPEELFDQEQVDKFFNSLQLVSVQPVEVKSDTEQVEDDKKVKNQSGRGGN